MLNIFHHVRKPKLPSGIIFFALQFILVLSSGQSSLEYAEIERGRLFVMEKNQNERVLLMGSQTDRKITRTRLSHNRGYGHHFKWHTFRDSVVWGSIDHQRFDAFLGISSIEQRDTASCNRMFAHIMDSLLVLDVDADKGFYMASSRAYPSTSVLYSLLPLSNWMNQQSCLLSNDYRTWKSNVIRSVDYDLTFSDGKLLILIRTGEVLEYWEWSIPHNHSTMPALTLVRRYSIITDATADKENICYYPKGNFKVVVQKGHTFAIHLQSGKIFHVGAELEQVGELLFEERLELNFYGRALIVKDSDRSLLLTSQRFIRFPSVEFFPNITKPEDGMFESYFQNK